MNTAAQQPWFEGIKIKLGTDTIGTANRIYQLESKVDSAPSLTLNNVKFAKQHVMAFCSRGVLHVKTQLRPFDIQAKHNGLRIDARNCWMSSMLLGTDDGTIVDQLKVECESCNISLDLTQSELKAYSYEICQRRSQNPQGKMA